MLIFAVIVVLVVAMVVWGVNESRMPAPGSTIVKVGAIIIGAVIILQKAGLLA